MTPQDTSLMMTPDMFMEYRAWPGDKPTFYGGGECWNKGCFAIIPLKF